MQPNFVTKGVVSRERILLAEGAGPALLAFSLLRTRIIAEIDRETATLFAEPVITDRGDQLEVAWYSEYGGSARPLAALDGDLQAHIAAKLRARLAKLEILLSSDIAPVLRCALQVARPDGVLAIGDEPVLVEWGIAPEGEKADPAGAARRFAAVIGPYAPFGYASPQLRRPPPAVAAVTAPPPAAASPDQLPRSQSRGLVIATIAAAVCALALALPGVLATPIGQDGDDIATAAAVTRAMQEKVDRARAALGSFDCGKDGDATPASANPDLPPEPIRAPANIAPPGPKTPGGEANAKPDAASAQPPAQSNPMALVARRAAESVVYILTCADSATWHQKMAQSGDASAKPVACPIQPGDGGKPADLVAMASGSGFFIGPDRIVTNEHVVQDAKAIVIASQSLGLAAQATVVAATTTTGPEADFAVLSVSVPNPPPPVPLSLQVSSLENVVAAGYPGIIVEAAQFLGLTEGQQSLPDLTTFPGYVTVLKNTGGEVPFIVTSATIGHGNSGGPLLDLCASAIGVNTLGWNGEKQDKAYQVNVAEGAKALEAFLDAHAIPYQAAPDNCGGAADKPAAPPENRK